MISPEKAEEFSLGRIAKKEVPPEDKKPPITHTRGICFLKKRQTPGEDNARIFINGISQPWQVGGREI